MSRFVRKLVAGITAVLASTAVVACGSASPRTSASRTNPSSTQAQQLLLSFSRCMRSHGVPSFPDPSAGGGFNFAGISSASPAFKAAQTACKDLLPVKRPPSVAPSRGAFTRLVHWAACMRAHGISGMPDPRPNPPPGPNSPLASRYGTLMGDGDYWVGIPISVDAHSPAFTRLSTTCGESPSGPTH